VYICFFRMSDCNFAVIVCNRRDLRFVTGMPSDVVDVVVVCDILLFEIDSDVHFSLILVDPAAWVVSISLTNRNFGMIAWFVS